jgi:hypothetical protein
MKGVVSDIHVLEACGILIAMFLYFGATGVKKSNELKKKINGELDGE